MTGIPYDESLVRQVGSTLDLRMPNLSALDAIAKSIETVEHGAEVVADLATGVGKTYIAGGILDYLQAQGVRSVVIVTPGSAIQRKTIANLTPGTAKYLRGLQSKPMVITLDDVEIGTVGEALEDDSVFKVFVLTVQSLLRPDTKQNRRAHRPHEMLGATLSSYLARQDDLVVIADEHHTYFGSSAKRFRAAIEQLDPTVVVGLTATPHESTEAHIVFRYPLAEAIADGFVKIPVLVGRTDGVNDLRTQLADGLALLDAKRSAMAAYCGATQQAEVRPVMFVVADKIAEANKIREMLVADDMLASEDQVLLVTSDQPDEVLSQLDALEDPGSKVRAVVSVSMLKEGWDVKNIYVIAAVRALESDLLTEQVLGRGLRLPFGKRTGVGMLDTVEVISHHSFRDLLTRAESLLLQTLGDRSKEAEALAIATAGLKGLSASPADAANAAASSSAQRVSFTLPGIAPAEVDSQGKLFDLPTGNEDTDTDTDEEAQHEVAVIGSVQDRLSAGQETTDILRAVLRPNNLPGIHLPLFIPRVTTRLVREAFSLSEIGTIETEALGRKFANDNTPTLKRKALEATRTLDGVAVEIRDRSDDSVAASQTRLPFDSIELDLVQRLMTSNAVAASVAEMNAARSLAAAFLRGASVSEVTPWRTEHGRLATAALVEWISNKQKERPATRVVDVSQLKWPEPPEITQSNPPADRNLIGRAADFVRGYPYAGWKQGIYPVNSFDAYGTEFRLAEIFDGGGGQIRAWARITNLLPLNIEYQSGAGIRTYVPDFVVVDSDDVYWIVEGKRDDDMTSDNVIAKRDAAVRWVGAVNASADVHQTWTYLLASESVVRNSGSWSALKAAAQVYR